MWWDKNITLTSQWAKQFGIISKKNKRKNPFDILIKSIKKDKNKISVNFKIKDDEKKLLFKSVSYKIKELTSYQLIFIGWAYIILDDYKNNYKEIAKEYLKEAIKRDVDSCLPYYLLASENLEQYENWEMKKLYQATEKPDVFPDFYCLLWRKEKNRIRAEAMIKKGIKRFPHNLKLTLHHAENLYNKKKFAEALKIIKDGQPFKIEYWVEHCNLIYLASSIYTELKKYQDAQRIIQKSALQNDVKNFFLGLVFFKQKRYKQAAENFTKAIEENYENGDISKASLYYLLNCYYRLGQKKEVERIVDLLPKDGEWFVFPLHHHFADLAEQTLKLILKKYSDERLKSKISGFLAAVILDNKFRQGEKSSRKRELTKAEKQLLNNTIKLAKEAVRFHPDDGFFNLVLSHLLSINGDYDNSFYQGLYALSEQTQTEQYSLVNNHNFEKCSEKFITEYPEKLASVYNEIHFPIKNYIDNYFGYDIDWLYKKKNYQIISNLYHWAKSKSDWTEFGKQLEENKKEFGEYAGGGLFEIAYSLNENEERDEAKKIYEYLVQLSGETSTVMNNLAIIYKEKGDLRKAKEFIKKAKSLLGNEEDEIIDKNFALFVERSKKRRNTTKSPKKEHETKSKKSLPIFNAGNGEIVFGNKKCRIPFSSNQHQLCKAIFEKPLGERVKEIDVVENFYRGSDGQRSFYDAVRLVNQKVEKDIGIKRLIEFKAASARIRKEIFE